MKDLYQPSADGANPVPDARKAAEFLTRLTGGGPIAVAAIVPDSRDSRPVLGDTFTLPENSGALSDWIEENNRRANLYFSLNVPRPEGERTGKAGRLREADVAEIRGISVDLDPIKDKPLEDERARLAAIAEREAGNVFGAPTAIVDSGGGVQMHWVFPEPLANTPENAAAVKAQARGLAQAFGEGSDAVHSLEHLFRIPFTRNIPDAKKRARSRKEALAAVLYEPGERTPLLALRCFAAPAPESPAQASGGPNIDLDYAAVMEALGDPSQLEPRFRSIAEEVAANRASIVGDADGDRSESDYRILCHLVQAHWLEDPTELAQVWSAVSPDKLAEKERMGRGENYCQRTVGKVLGRYASSRFFEPEDLGSVPAAASEGDGAIRPIHFRPWAAKDLSAIPKVKFLYSDFYARGYTSLTLAAPKVGKSLLGMAEAMDMATGRGILTELKSAPLRVVYYNAEDDQDAIDARVAALLTEYEIDQSEIEGRFWPVSGVGAGDFFLVSGQEGKVNESLFRSLERFITDNQIDVLIFDPLQDLSRSPETNEVLRILGQRLRKLANWTDVALGLIHHTRKVAPGQTATIDDGRGGSALRGTARFNRILIAMTEDEGARAGVENHRHFFRIGDMESNLAPPSADVNRWFRKASVLTPNAAFIGAVVPWEWPDVFDGITKQQVARVRAEIAQSPEPLRSDLRATAWVGHLVGRILSIEIDSKGGKARVKQIIDNWVRTGVLREYSGKDPRKGTSVKFITCGDNDPLAAEEGEG